MYQMPQKKSTKVATIGENSTAPSAQNFTCKECTLLWAELVVMSATQGFSPHSSGWEGESPGELAGSE